MISFACKDIEFKDLLRCSFDLTKTQYHVLMLLLRSGKMNTAPELAELLHIDRTSVQKAIKGLVEKELVERRQENLRKGGYLFHYSINNKSEIKNRMEHIVEKWHEAVLSEIRAW